MKLQNVIFFGKIKNNEHLLMSLLERCKNLVLVTRNTGDNRNYFMMFLGMLKFYKVEFSKKMKVKFVDGYDKRVGFVSINEKCLEIFNDYKNYLFIFGTEWYDITNLSCLFVNELCDVKSIKIYKEPSEFKNHEEELSMRNHDLYIFPDSEACVSFYKRRYKDLTFKNVLELEPDFRSSKFKRCIKYLYLIYNGLSLII